MKRILKFFKRIFGMRSKFTIILKSGKTFNIYGTNLKLRLQGDNILGYELEGGTGKLFYLRIDEVAAILHTDNK